MAVSQAQKAASAKWDKENMTTLSTRVTKQKAQAFRQACADLNTKPNQVFLKAIDETIAEAGKKSSK